MRRSASLIAPAEGEERGGEADQSAGDVRPDDVPEPGRLVNPERVEEERPEHRDGDGQDDPKREAIQRIVLPIQLAFSGVERIDEQEPGEEEEEHERPNHAGRRDDGAQDIVRQCAAQRPEYI